MMQACVAWEEGGTSGREHLWQARFARDNVIEIAIANSSAPTTA